MKRLTLIPILTVLWAGCAPPPPNLTPEATQAFKATRVIKALDILRDAAIDANAQTPPLMPEATTRRVVLYHQSSVKIIQATADGWVPTVLAGLTELEANLAPPEKALLGPYIALAKTIIQEVAR